MMAKLKSEDGNEVIDFTAHSPQASWDFSTLKGVRKVNWNLMQGKGRLQVHKITETLPELLAFLQHANSDLLRLECQPVTLDDLFVNLTGRRLDE